MGILLQNECVLCQIPYVIKHHWLVCEKKKKVEEGEERNCQTMKNIASSNFAVEKSQTKSSHKGF